VPTPGAAPSSTAFYGPRFDFDPVTLQPRGLLVEEQRTNLFTYSDDFANAAWTKSSATVTANQAVSPDGTTNADLLQITAQFGRLQAGSVTLGTVYTFSIWARTASGTRVYSLYDAAGNPIGTLTATTAWTRHTITFTAPATSTLYVMQDRNAGPFVDTFIYGAQLEAGAFATSYIPTVASTVTRSADVATINGSLFSQWFNQSEGSWAFDFGPFNFSGVIAGTAPYDTAIGAVTNGVRAGKQFSIQNFTGWVVQNKTGTPVGSTAIAGSAAFAPLTGPAAAQKLAVFQSPSAAGGSINGSAVTTTTITAAPTGTADLFYINPLMNGWLRNIRFIPARAADFQLQAIST